MTMYPSPRESLPEIWYLYNEEDQPVFVFGKGHIETIIFQRAAYFAFEREIDREDIQRGYIDQGCIEEGIDSDEVFLAHFLERSNGDHLVRTTIGKIQRPVFTSRRK